ncbi:MAG: arylsulfatase [Puniceicoccaceae bacterium]
MSEDGKTANERPNLVLIMTDQQRGDCLGVEGHPVLETPHLDSLSGDGIRFRRAYSTCPQCIPARRTVMTGRSELGHGVLCNYQTQMDLPTLPEALGRAGYQTHLVGKLHMWPPRKLFGFDSADWADSPHRAPVKSDYDRFLEREGVSAKNAGMMHGLHENGWVSRPWPLDEHLHFSNWCTDCGIEFLERRDPTRPFFLKLSYHQPHPPCSPPAHYFDHYMSKELPEPYVGDWVSDHDEVDATANIAPWRTHIRPEAMKRFRAGYYGCISHIDEQIGRFLYHLPRNTAVVFVSDHGEMLGDHYYFRKCSGYEGSARVPFIMKLPREYGIERGAVSNDLVTLADLMPTLLDLAGAECPEGVEGRSLLELPAISKEGNTPWRNTVRGESALVPTSGSGTQWITDGDWKYIWYPGTGEEQLFDLVNDPNECVDRVADPAQADRVSAFRKQLVEELKDRPEGFVEDGDLRITGGPTDMYLEGYKREPFTMDMPGIKHGQIIQE